MNLNRKTTLKTYMLQDLPLKMSLRIRLVVEIHKVLLASSSAGYEQRFI